MTWFCAGVPAQSRQEAVDASCGQLCILFPMFVKCSTVRSCSILPVLLAVYLQLYGDLAPRAQGSNGVHFESEGSEASESAA